MRGTRTYLAIDLGAESGRAILGAFDGERLTLSEIHRFRQRPGAAARWVALGCAAPLERDPGEPGVGLPAARCRR